MANISLSKENIKYIRDAFSHFFPEDALYSADKPYTSGEFNWDNRKEFIGFVYRLTGIQIKSEKDFENIKKAQLAVEKLAETPDKRPESNIQTKEQREQAEMERQKREASQKKAVEDAKNSIENAILRQQEIQENLNAKKIYAKVEITKGPPQLQASTVSFIEQAKEHPASFQKDIAENIKARITPSLSTRMSIEEIGAVADKVAFDTVSTINNFPVQSSANTQSAILTALSKDTKVLPKVVPDNKTAEILKRASLELGYFKNGTQFSKNILSAFNENLAENVFGIGPENLSVSFSDQPAPGYNHEVDLGNLNQGHIKILEAQSDMLDNVISFGSDKAKSFLTEQTRTFIDSKIAKLPADSAIRGIYNSELGQQVLSFVGLGKTAPIGETFLGENILGPSTQRFLGGSTFLERVAGVFGIDFAAKTTASAIESVIVLSESAEVIEGATTIGTGITAVAGTAIGVETEAITKLLTPIAGKTAASALTRITTSILGKGATAAVNTALQSLGSLVPVIGNAIALAVGWLAGKIAEKINWKKVKEAVPYLLGLIAGGGTLIVAGPVPGVAVGIGTFAITSAATAGAVTVVAVGSRIGFVFGSLVRSTGTVIGLPFVIVILVLPVVVTIILFIINSGAYVVPPSDTLSRMGADNPYMLVTKAANPSKIDNNGSKKVEYTVKITALKTVLTNIKIVGTECIITKKEGGSSNCPPENIAALPPDLTIDPSSDGYTFGFSAQYDSNLTDSLIYDSISITAVPADEPGEIKTKGSASVCIGDCAIECLQISDKGDAWPGNLRSNMEQAAMNLGGGFAKFIGMVCQNETEVNLCYKPGRIKLGYFAWHVHDDYKDGCDVYFNSSGVGSSNDALFMITHELTHHIQTKDGSTVSEYEASGAYAEVSNSGFCTYSDTRGSKTESMAEADGLFASIPSWGGCAANYSSLYPLNYKFAQGFMR